MAIINKNRRGSFINSIKFNKDNLINPERLNKDNIIQNILIYMGVSSKLACNPIVQEVVRKKIKSMLDDLQEQGAFPEFTNNGDEVKFIVQQLSKKNTGNKFEDNALNFQYKECYGITKNISISRNGEMIQVIDSFLDKTDSGQTIQNETNIFNKDNILIKRQKEIRRITPGVPEKTRYFNDHLVHTYIRDEQNPLIIKYNMKDFDFPEKNMSIAYMYSWKNDRQGMDGMVPKLANIKPENKSIENFRSDMEVFVDPYIQVLKEKDTPESKRFYKYCQENMQQQSDISR